MIELDISTVEPSLAGPKRPQDKVLLSKADESFAAFAKEIASETNTGSRARISIPEIASDVGDGDVTIAAITSP